MENNELQERIAKLEVKVENTKEDMDHLHTKINEMKDKCSKDCIFFFASKEQFAPVRNIVYGMAGIIMTSFLIALITLVMRK